MEFEICKVPLTEEILRSAGDGWPTLPVDNRAGRIHYLEHDSATSEIRLTSTTQKSTMIWLIRISRDDDQTDEAFEWLVRLHCVDFGRRFGAIEKLSKLQLWLTDELVVDRAANRRGIYVQVFGYTES